MEILDHFEQHPSNFPPPITRKTYLQQAGILFLAIGGVFIASSLGVLYPFPVFESLGGWILMVSTYLATLFFYKKIIKTPFWVLVISLLGWMVAGLGAVFFVMKGLVLGRYDYLPAGLLIWILYTLIEWLLFRLLYGWQQKRASS